MIRHVTCKGGRGVTRYTAVSRRRHRVDIVRLSYRAPLCREADSPIDLSNSDASCGGPYVSRITGPQGR